MVFGRTIWCISALLASVLTAGGVIAPSGVASADVVVSGGVQAGDIVFATQGDAENPPELAIRRSDGTVGKLLTLASDDVQVDPAVSPDGSKIAFDSRLSGRQAYELYVMNSDTSNLAEVTTTPSDNTAAASRFVDWFPSWCGNGKLVFQRQYASNPLRPDQSTNTEIWAMKADGSGQAEISSDDTKDDIEPACSPDGSRVAFSRRNDSTGHYELWYMNSDGSGASLVANQPATGDNDEPVWASNSRLCFHNLAVGTGTGDIFCINASGDNLTQVTHSTFGQDPERPTVSADGSVVGYYLFPVDDLVETAADGTGTPQDLTAGSGTRDLNPALVKATWQPSCMQAPSPPQDVSNSATSDRQVTVNWDDSAPGSGCAVVDHYAIHSTTVNPGGSVAVGSVIATIPAGSTLPFDNHYDTGPLTLCTFYEYGISAVSTSGQESDVVLPTAPAFTQGYPDKTPKTVTILIQGVNSSISGGSWNPLTQDDYCSSLDGNDSDIQQGTALGDLAHAWLNVNDSGKDDFELPGNQHNVVDTAAATGGLVLPLSYVKGTTLTGTAASPKFTIPAYKSRDVAQALPTTVAGYLNTLIGQIGKIWPSAKIVIIGHSNGGLVAQQWWAANTTAAGGSAQHHVSQVLTLDSPINGLAAGVICRHPTLLEQPGCKAINTLINQAFGSMVSSSLVAFYGGLWASQSTNDPQWAKLAARNHMWTPFVTEGDPLYDAGDAIALKSGAADTRIGWASQGLVNSKCASLDWQAGCNLTAPDEVSQFTYDDGNALPYGLLLGDIWVHSVVKNDANVIAALTQLVSS